jgi:hypothetical protein
MVLPGPLVLVRQLCHVRICSYGFLRLKRYDTACRSLRKKVRPPVPHSVSQNAKVIFLPDCQI